MIEYVDDSRPLSRKLQVIDLTEPYQLMCVRLKLAFLSEAQGTRPPFNNNDPRC